MRRLFVGLMSGTSLDGVDGVVVDFSGAKPNVLQHAAQPFDAAFKTELLALNSAGDNELHRAALAGNMLVRVYDRVVGSLLAAGGFRSRDIEAIGAHGQTVRHRPGEFDGIGYTLQLNQPALLAELSGICVVCDFRSRDVAAGGQGAPLVPVFHRRVFGRSDSAVAVVNIGGIANLSFLAGSGAATGFDCGPGNGLLDHWCQRHTGRPFDAAGAWAASGRIVPALLEALRHEEPWFALAPPKSTGRDRFNPAWLDRRLASFPDLAPNDVQATLAELTADSIARAVSRHGNGSKTLIVCGGGALNLHLMRRLAVLLPRMRVESSAEHGLPPLQVEAAAFAWFAQEALARRPLELSAVTGARGERIAGAIYPA